ncbi:MAG: chemotaxis protein CheW [Firmicutes bacterium]|nr:chemotaxis protein CheW [Alicyclobacillaceae bacterium]MCL6497051.1 chemotaxis protein CheW [Bacillota bacterium]
MERPSAAARESSTAETAPLLVVAVGEDRWAAPTTRVVEIVALPPVTPLPLAPPLVIGVAVLRGQPLVVLTPRPGGNPGPVALRWVVDGQGWLVAVDGVERLWRPGPSLPATAWQTLAPPEAPVAAAYRLEDGWVWQWPDDLPWRLLRGRSPEVREEGRHDAS